MNAEQSPLEETRRNEAARKKWGPYLSERQWGSVCGDYSGGRNARDHVSYDQARKRATIGCERRCQGSPGLAPVAARG